MRFARLLAVAVSLAAMACGSTPTGLRYGPYAGYDIEDLTIKTETVHDAGIVEVTRYYQVSPPGKDHQYMTGVMDVRNTSDFAFCVRMGAFSKYRNVTVVDKGVVVVGPHSVLEAVVVASTDDRDLEKIAWSVKRKVWPADREGRCENE